MPRDHTFKVVDTAANEPERPIAVGLFSDEEKPPGARPPMGDYWQDAERKRYAEGLLNGMMRVRMEDYQKGPTMSMYSKSARSFEAVRADLIAMQMLSTAPEHERRGAATMLLRAFTKCADEKGFRCQVDASGQAKQPCKCLESDWS